MEIKAANSGNYESELELGKYYFEGKFVEKDYKKAYDYFNKLINSKDEDIKNTAYYYLGIMYQEGKGTQKDTNMAAKYFTEAVKSSDKIEVDISKERLKECKNNIEHTLSDEQLIKNVKKKKTLKDQIGMIIFCIVCEYLAVNYIPWKIVKYIAVIWIGIALIMAIIDPKSISED